MKILFHHRIASRDGQSVHLEELIEALRADGHEIILVGPASFAAESFGGSSGLVDRLKAMLPAAAFELLELGYNIPAFFRLWRAVIRHRPDAIYERFNLFLLAGVLLRRVSDLPLLLEVNAPLFEERAATGHVALEGLARWCQGRIWRGADVVLPVTDVLAGHVRAYGVADRRITTIPNGINPRRFGTPPSSSEAKRALGLDGRLVLGFTGFVWTWNRLDRAIEFLAAHGARLDAHLLLVGDGPARAELEALAQAAGVSDRVTITGIVARDAVMRHVAAFDIALQPALTAYASPLKLFEYLYLGRAVVAPDMPNIREVLTDGEDALLFDAADSASFASALLRLSEDAALRERLGHAARATIDRRGFTWAANAARVVGLATMLCRTKAEMSVG